MKDCIVVDTMKTAANMGIFEFTRKLGKSDRKSAHPSAGVLKDELEWLHEKPGRSAGPLCYRPYSQKCLWLNMDSRELIRSPLPRMEGLAASTCSTWDHERYWRHETHSIAYRRDQML